MTRRRREARAAGPATSSVLRPPASPRTRRPRRRACRRAARWGAARFRSIVEAPCPVYRSAFAESLGTVPSPSLKQPPARIQIQDVRPQVDCGRYPVKSTQGDPVERLGEHLQGRARHSSRSRPLPATRALASGSSARSSRSGTTTGRDASRRPRSAAGSSRSRPGSTATRRCSTSSTASSPPARVDLSSELSEAEALFGPGTVEDWHAAAPKLGAKDRHGKASLARPLEVDVERERARFGAWYELFPR